MLPELQFLVEFVTLTEEVVNGKLNFCVMLNIQFDPHLYVQIGKSWRRNLRSAGGKYTEIQQPYQNKEAKFKIMPMTFSGTVAYSCFMRYCSMFSFDLPKNMFSGGLKGNSGKKKVNGTTGQGLQIY